MFKPLPDYITIKESPISGLGLFATEPIKAHTYIGVILIEHKDEIIRTPLGGFGNHSDNPNCEKRKHKVFHLPSEGGIVTIPPWNNKWNLFTLRDIEVGEELTWRYTLYEINDENA